MNVVVARAPGKIFVTGEYAVLRGAPAVVAAIDLYAEAQVTPSTAAGLLVESLAETVHTLVDETGPPAGGDVGVAVAGWRAVRQRLGAAATHQGFAVRIDSRPFLRGSRKLGLGRSAATLVAVVAALMTAVGAGDHALALAVAMAANEVFQAGEGSGGDVAAAWHGGVVRVRRQGGELEVVPQALPAGLRLLVGWTGEAATTTPLLRRFSAATATVVPPALATLEQLATEAADAVAGGDAAVLRRTVQQMHAALVQLGRETGLPIVTPMLARLVAAAERAGAVAKASGAGGGDCGIALADSPAQADAVAAEWRAVGIEPLPLAIAARGVVVG